MDEITVLVFELGGTGFGTDIAQVVGMERMMGREPYEYDAEGRIIFPRYGPTRIIDVAERFGERIRLQGVIGGLRVLLMREETDNAGIVVDRVKGIKKIPVSQVYDLPALLKGAASPAIFGIARDDGDLLLLVDLKGLAEYAEDIHEENAQS